MQISRIIITNFRNIKKVDVTLNQTTVLIGENNSGKSNFLKALSLPFLSEGSHSKNLSWLDINSTARDSYYEFLLSNKKSIIDNTMDVIEFSNSLPEISVCVELTADPVDCYYLKELATEVTEDEIKYALCYEYKPRKNNKIYEIVKDILSSEEVDEDNISKIQLSLLPTEEYEHNIVVPGKGAVSYDVLRRFRNMLLEAERDDFSSNNGKIGSNSLIKILKMRVDDKDKLLVEKKYSEFFETIKKLSGMDEVLNWQDMSKIENANEFISNITIMPNMPPMTSILNSVRLGYDDKNLSLQGLGQRNLILLLVLINSLLEKNDERPFTILEVEEPEAHLCFNNIRLLSSFLNAFTENNKAVQVICSSHSTEFINKLSLDNLIIMNQGNAVSLANCLGEEAREYLSKNPNLDIYKLFFSKRCILVEGLTEELLIRAYLKNRGSMHQIEVIAFHKGYKDIINIWKNINKDTDRKLAVIRDYDNQDNAKSEHENLACERVCVTTTKEETLEPEIVNSGKNYEILKTLYGEEMGWTSLSPDELQKDWRESKSFVMFRLCRDIENNMDELKDFSMPAHIQKAIEFMESKGED